MMTHNLHDWGEALIVAGLTGILGPLMAIGWWNATMRKPASPALVKGVWLYFGGLSVLFLIAMLVIDVFHIRLHSR